MTDTANDTTQADEGGLLAPPPGFKSPEQEGLELGENVPAADELSIDEINPLNAHLFAENRWHRYFERLRAEDPIHFNEMKASGRYWSVTKFDDIREIEKNWETYSSAAGITLGIPVNSEQLVPEQQIKTFIAMDPPEHRDQRRTVTPAVQPQNLNNVEPMIRERTVEVLDSLPEGETFDWVDTVSIELTTRMLATLFDFPFEDRRKLTRWSDVVFAIPGEGIIDSHEQRRDELMECVHYFAQLWEERRENPGFDLVSMLVHGEHTKDMSPLEHLGNLLLLIVGGNDTTRNTMSGSVYGLNKFPEQYDKLIANPDLVRNAVSEILRWQTPLSYMRRTATRDVELGGKQIKKDDQILLWFLSANRDEDVFENADAIDIERHNADQQLAFGFGIHRCMGSRLAEMQLRVLWEEVLERFERITVVGEPTRTLSSFVHGYTYLPVQVTRK
jgi:cytochrome P450